VCYQLTGVNLILDVSYFGMDGRISGRTLKN